MQGDLFFSSSRPDDAEFSAILREAEQYHRGMRDCLDVPDTSPATGVNRDAKQQPIFQEV